MIDIDNFIWPASDVRGKKAIVPEAREAIPGFLPFVKGRNRAIQAGANVGVYPALLSEHFDWVECYEPHRGNATALAENLKDIHNVECLQKALGQISNQRVKFNETEPDNCGAHTFHAVQDEDERHHTRTVALDDIHRTHCDLIWLDCEGAELPALRGAIKTILAFSPVIILEEKNHGKLFGYSLDDLHAFLAGLGYSEKARCYNDRLYTR